MDANHIAGTHSNRRRDFTTVPKERRAPLRIEFGAQRQRGDAALSVHFGYFWKIGSAERGRAAPTEQRGEDQNER
jgi:hypothetical protein